VIIHIVRFVYNFTLFRYLTHLVMVRAVSNRLRRDPSNMLLVTVISLYIPSQQGISKILECLTIHGKFSISKLVDQIQFSCFDLL
jgi:hypothetical protein